MRNANCRTNVHRRRVAACTNHIFFLANAFFATNSFDGGANPSVCPAQKQVTTWFNNARKRLLHKRITPKHLKRAR